MKKHSFTAALLIVTLTEARSQHCPWDGTSFIMLDVPSNLNIKNIYLVDSAGTVVTSNWYYGHDSVRVDSAIFWRNSGIDKNASYQERKTHFAFAKDYYILSFGQYQRSMTYQLKVLSEKDKVIETQLVPLPGEYIHPLCTDNKELWDGKIRPLKLKL